MIDFLMQYGLFLAKTLTLIIGLLILLSSILALSQKGKMEEGTFVVLDMNEKFQEIRHQLQEETLPKNEWKKWLKSQKETLKKKAKIASKTKENKENAESFKPRVFIIRFDGDMRASQVKQLREAISAIIEIALSHDEVLIILDSAGGYVHTYGLAASQLERLRQHDIHLTVAIDKCAASGGYLMACVANKILAAPFAIVGSIGVIAQLPNFHRLLNKHHIDYEMHTAGEYKRTVTLFGKNTEKGRKKFQQELELTHTLFKEHITQYRPQVAINEIATGEHWHAITALKLNMVDEIQTSDDFILKKIQSSDVFEISYKEKQKLSEKLTGNVFQAVERMLVKWLTFRPAFFR